MFKKLSSDFRREAKFALKGNYSISLLVAVIAYLLGVQVSSGGISFNIKTEDMESILPKYMTFELLIVLCLIGLMILISIVGSFIIGSIVKTGYAKFNLNLVNFEKVNIGLLFKYFKYTKKMIITNLVIMLKIFLWSLLFIIPGIIKAYSYAMVPYILAENPNLSTKEALDLSKKMMNGNKWRLFCLQISFIGWIILCALTFGIGYIFLAPYQKAAEACFYKDISTNYWNYLNRPKPLEDKDDNLLTVDDILNKKPVSNDRYYSELY